MYTSTVCEQVATLLFKCT